MPPQAPQPQPIFNLNSILVILIGLNGGIFALGIILPATITVPIWAKMALTPAAFWAGPEATGGWLPLLMQPITYAFLHADFQHLAFNTIWLLIFGTPVAQRLMAIGSLSNRATQSAIGKFLLFYLGGAVIAGLFHAAIYKTSLSPLVGASGAVSALMGGATLFMFRRGQRYGAFSGPLSRLSHPPVLLFTAVTIGTNVFTGLEMIKLGSATQNIAWEAHIAGYIYGLLVFPIFDTQAKPQRDLLIARIEEAIRRQS